MLRLRPLLLTLGSLVLTALANGQGFNIDVGPNLILWPAPSSSYGAAAGQTGHWNEVKNPFAGDTLLDLSAGLSGVTLASNVSSSFSYPFGTFGPDDDAFTSDGQAISYFGPAAVWTFAGLADGQYDVYTYAWDPANSGALSDVTIVGLPASTQTVGGIWGGTPHVPGVTYARHSITVSGGTFAVEVYGNSSGVSATVLGFQVVPAANYTTICFGDGSGTACPCGNFGALDEGCRNSSGSGASLSASGSSSVGSDDLTLQLTQGPGNVPAIVFAGTTQVNGGAGAVFGDGLLCAGGMIQRLGVKFLSGGAATWGPGLAPQGGWGAGDTRVLQGWYRDVSGPCNGQFNTSHALAVTFQP
jgi:hypothetical protein